MEILQGGVDRETVSLGGQTNDFPVAHSYSADKDFTLVVPMSACRWGQIAEKLRGAHELVLQAFVRCWFRLERLQGVGRESSGGQASE
jgi:hypothetical protein